MPAPLTALVLSRACYCPRGSRELLWHRRIIWITADFAAPRTSPSHRAGRAAEKSTNMKPGHGACAHAAEGGCLACWWPLSDPARLCFLPQTGRSRRHRRMSHNYQNRTSAIGCSRPEIVKPPKQSCQGQAVPSAREMTIGHGFPLPDQPEKGRTATYRAGSRRQLWLRRPLCYRRRQPRGAIWGIPVKAIRRERNVVCFGGSNFWQGECNGTKKRDNRALCDDRASDNCECLYHVPDKLGDQDDCFAC